VVAAELRAGVTAPSELKRLEEDVLRPYFRRGRIVTPSAAAWEALGAALATLVREDGLQLRTTPRSFVFDILIAYSCREHGALLVSANVRDLNRIARIFTFDFVAPFPDLTAM
jgi:predicted nucleic acid-binding protein